MPRPFLSHCPTCERDHNADWIDERGRYECDACQKDFDGVEETDEATYQEAAE